MAPKDSNVHPQSNMSPSHDAVNLHLKQENDKLRRLLMNAQELLVKRNERLTDLQGQLQGLKIQDDPASSRLQDSAEPGESIGVQSISSASSSSKSSQLSVLVTPITSNVSAGKEHYSTTTKSLIQRAKLMQHKSKVLPREKEMEETLIVQSFLVTDGAGEKGMYTGTVLSMTLVPHGKGHMVYDEHRSFMGQWKEGHWHGKGHMMSRVYDYRGMFDRDLKEGLGILKWSDGRVYKGEFHKDKPHGKGLLTYADGSSYKGEFHCGVRQGKGKCIFAGGGQYVGYWKNGVFHGHGQCTWPDGCVYLGEWRAGKAYGHGMELEPNGTVKQSTPKRNVIEI